MGLISKIACLPSKFIPFRMNFPMEDLVPVNVELWTNPFDNLSFGIKVTTVTVAVSILTFGTAAHCLIISLERFAGDPQKRGLVNQASILMFSAINLT